MKKLFLMIWLIAVKSSFSQANSYELTGPVGKDTVNLMDINNFKQGKWAIRGMHQPAKGYRGDQLMEEGIYKDNMKVGEWIFYHNNGNIKNKILFVNGRMNGPYIAYHRDGSMFLEGERTSNHWKGKLSVHDKFGNTLIIDHDENGKELSKEFIKTTK